MAAQLSGSLIVRVGGQLLALPVGSLRDLLPAAPIVESLAHAPRHCLGLVWSRSRRVPLFDLGGRLGLSPSLSARSCGPEGRVEPPRAVVVVADPCGDVGYLVDELRAVVGGALPGGGAVWHAGRRVPLLDPAFGLTALARHQLRAALAPI